MSIESLKQQARKHEQNEEWHKALEDYNKALAELAREEQVDIGLYNRVGDLFVRVGQVDPAVEHYEKAVELYREAYLPNNAIAVCKKIIRNVPERHRAYLVIGQIRAEQGFIPDARTNFLTYAERMQQAGDMTESFRALIEFCDLAPDDIGVRMTVAEQMASQGMTDEAVEQLIIVRRHYEELDDTQQVEDLATRILHLNPDADLSAPVASSSMSSDGEIVADFGEIGISDDAFSMASEDEVSFSFQGATESAEEAAEAVEDAAEEAASDFGGFEIEASGDDDADEGGFELPMMDTSDEAEADPLPTFDSAGDDEGGEDDAVELPTMDFDTSDDGGSDGDESIGDELPMMDIDTSDVEEVATELPGFDDEPEPVPIPTIDFGADDEPAADDAAESEPDVEDEAPTMGLEDAFDAMADSFESVEEAMEEAAPELPGFDEPAAAEPVVHDAAFESPGLTEPEPTPVEPVAEPVLDSPVETVEPVVEAPVEAEPEPEPEPAPAESKPDDGGFVDLGAMILGDTQEKSTRFTVAYEEPSGDEEADFAKMLSQFKDKVSENLEASDVRAHYDLGTAYKEMGLLDEAISSFQAALRASSDHLPTYELMGQTFIEMGQPEAAVRSLERSIEVANTVDDELVGIYYYLGRAYEELGNKESAVEYYDRVFSLDINFADVTERLRELR
ncbi:MAG: tetratricopeptide repeat protein [Gemmatimonadota bacterium]